jgi:hypothetical protein
MLGMLLEAFLRVRYFYRCLCSGFSVILQGKPFALKDKETIMSGNFVVHYELTPPPEMAQEDFVRLVQEEVFPAVEMGPTRVGQITDLYLLTSQGAEKYLWVINSTGWLTQYAENILFRTEAARQKLEACGTRISAPSPLYKQVARRDLSTESGSQETGP